MLVTADAVPLSHVPNACAETGCQRAGLISNPSPTRDGRQSEPRDATSAPAARRRESRLEPRCTHLLAEVHGVA